jgi:hypothetical protein
MMFIFNPMPKHGYVMNETTSPAYKRGSITPLKIFPFLFFQIFQHAIITISMKKGFLKAILAADKEP